VAAPVVALVDKGLPAMFMTKLPIALGLALTGLLVGAGLFLQGGTGAQPKAAQDPPVQGPVVGDARSAGAVPAAAAPGTPLGQNTSAVCVIRGRVLDPAGKPVAGAKLYRAYSLNSSIRPLPQAAQRTASGPDGRFEFVLSATELALGRQAPLQIAAAAEGYGPDWFEMTGSNAPRDLTFCLSRDDVPIQGRIVNLEGLPIRGVSVTVLSIAASQNDNLADLVRALTDKRQVDLKKFLRKGLDGLLEAPGIRAHATTDKDGRFHLHGIGRERVAMLLLGGSPVAADLVMVMTRPGQRYFVPDHPGSDMIFSVYGATFQHAAAPARPILGKVQDRNSGKPLPGVRVRFDFEPNDTLTDRNGHYRIDSIPRFAMSKPTDKLLVTATAPADQPYLVAIKELEPQGSAEPITLNFELKKGVWVQGRVNRVLRLPRQPQPARCSGFRRPAPRQHRALPRRQRGPLSRACLAGSRAHGRSRSGFPLSLGSIPFRGRGGQCPGAIPFFQLPGQYSRPGQDQSRPGRTGDLQPRPGSRHEARGQGCGTG
jgi:hypothetical protein